MSIVEKVSINTHYTRSVNLERDSGSGAVLDAYIPTSRALRTLERVASTLHDKQAPRAWSLVGPYGSGKSSFSVFASQLLSAPAEPATKAVFNKLAGIEPSLASSIEAATSNTKGMMQVLVTGAPEAMGRRILVGLRDALSQLCAGRRGKRPAVLGKMDSVIQSQEISASAVLGLTKELQLFLSKARYPGIVLFIDELGKFLEYEARHYGANDIYLLQALAEHACQGDSCNLYLFVMLHQSFEQYAKGLGENLKNEWSKVQGRFEEIPFIESSEQVLRVVGSALKQSLSKQEESANKKTIADVVDVLLEAKALPPSMKKKDAVGLFMSCYPLHPVSALVLPLLCQKVAQNERTLFSYLGSHEEHGLADMLNRLESTAEWVLPHHIFDYFISSQSAVLSDYATHRRWAEVVTALERLGDASGADEALLKSIGLLNIVGAKGGLKSSKVVLETIGNARTITKSLKNLTKDSVITYRKFNSEYRVWQGSDFDLEDALQQGLDHIGEFELADMLNREKSLQPVVARRYTIRNGALRYFTPTFVDARTYNKLTTQATVPRIILFLAAGQDDESIFFDEVATFYSPLDIVALIMNGSQLRESTGEVIALRHVGHSRPELNADLVAKREYQDRLSAAEHAQDVLLGRLLDTPEDCAWYYKSKPKPVANKRQFQGQLSSILEAVYNKSPELHNELVNRDKPSSTANAARNKLLYVMLNSAGQTDLGIDKFPPEKAVYRSILKETRLHQETELNQWQFCVPEKGSPFFHVWQRIELFLNDTEKEPMSFADLNAELLAPPYGVKAGILPILYIAVYCAYQQELAIYENRQYRPTLTKEMLDRFVRRPDTFTVQRFRIQGLRASIYEQYKTLFTDNEEKTVVQLVRPLANLIEGLPEFTQRTKSKMLSNDARAVRDAFLLSKSPEKLLFEELPNLLGYDVLAEGETVSLEGFAAQLTSSLRELKYFHSAMVKQQAELLCQALHLGEYQDLSELRRLACSRFLGLEQHTVDVDGLKAFIKRLTKREGQDDEWLDNVLMFLGRKPTAKWTDTDRAEAELRLSDFAKRILDLRKLRVHYDQVATSDDGEFDVILLKSLRQSAESGAESNEALATIDAKRREVISEVKNEISDLLDKHTDEELKLAILADLVDEFLANSKGGSAYEVSEAEPRTYRKRSIKRVK